MSRIFRLLHGLFDDGIKALSIFSAILSITFTAAKIIDAVPELRKVDYGWAFLPISIWLMVAYSRRWLAFEEQVEAPRPAAKSLASLHVTEIAEYVFNKSEWSWRAFGECISWNSVRRRVPDEMRRAGVEGEVRYLGARPNSQEIIEIDRAYWNFATIDEGRIWDRRNNFFSVAMGNSGAVPAIWHYQFGSAPKVDVMRTWPRASVWRKLRSYFRLFWVILTLSSRGPLVRRLRSALKLIIAGIIGGLIVYKLIAH